MRLRRSLLELLRSTLVEDFSKLFLKNAFKAWEFASKQHVRAAIENIDGYLKEKNIKLPVKAETPIKTSYQTELDTSPELKSEDGAY